MWRANSGTRASIPTSTSWISRLAAPAAGASLAQSLREFIFMEHHASLQAHLQTYALPIERRMQTGLALLLRCTEALSGESHRFNVGL